MKIGNLVVVIQPVQGRFKKIKERLILFFFMNGIMKNFRNKHQDGTFDNIGMNSLKRSRDFDFLKMLQLAFVPVIGFYFKNCQRLEIGNLLGILALAEKASRTK